MLDKRARSSRSVKPRKPLTNADRPIVAVIDDTACDETGVTFSTDDLITSLRTLPPQIIVSGNESAQFLKLMQDRYGSNPNFNFRVAPVEREIFTGKETGRKLSLSLTSVAYVGWQKEKCGRGNSIRNRYHLLIDPLTFSNKWLDDRTLAAYVAWAQEIRSFCVAQNWNLRPTQGSVARQALQDSRFYPDARRKVPRATNEVIRKQLPGNHYQLGKDVTQHTEYQGDYLDQSRCHHYHAINSKLPDSNTLYGYGHFRNPEGKPPYKRTPQRVESFLDGFMGLCYGTIYWPYSTRKVTQFLPRFLREYELGDAIYFYSEDLPLMESLGIRVTGIIAAWGSKQRDTGLARYAKWALEELGANPPVWKKTLLLSPYGALATTARKQTVAFHQSKNGKRETLVTRHGTRLEVSLHQTSKEAEPSTNNVLHRALIESSTRTETLLYARLLEESGYQVLCIYVDAVIVATDDDLSAPLLDPWRLDQQLTRLRFISESQFTSAELRKLPGIIGAQHKQFLSMGTVSKSPDIALPGLAHASRRRLGSKADMRLRAYEAWLNMAEEKVSP